MKQQQKQFVYYPFRGSSNSYTDNFKKCVEQLGYIEITSSIPKLLYSKLFLKPADLTIVNWIENDIISSNGKLSLLGVITVFVRILIIKFTSKKVLYIKHNQYPHKTIKKHRKIAKKITNRIELAFSDLVAIHSPVHTNNKRFYIPFPLYNVKTETSKTNKIKKDYYVLFGRIMRYKNITELLINLHDDTNLIIAGLCSDSTYLEELKSISKGNITIIENYMSDDEAAELVTNSKGLIVSHSSDNTTLSASFFFAASLGVKVFALKTDFLDHLSKNNTYPDLYAYETLKELCSDLKNHDNRQTDHKNNIKQVQKYFGTEATKKALSKILK